MGNKSKKYKVLGLASQSEDDFVIQSGAMDPSLRFGMTGIAPFAPFAFSASFAVKNQLDQRGVNKTGTATVPRCRTPP
jgi:hypothetical protein